MHTVKTRQTLRMTAVQKTNAREMGYQLLYEFAEISRDAACAINEDRLSESPFYSHPPNH